MPVHGFPHWQAFVQANSIPGSEGFVSGPQQPMDSSCQPWLGGHDGLCVGHIICAFADKGVHSCSHRPSHCTCEKYCGQHLQHYRPENLSELEIKLHRQSVDARHLLPVHFTEGTLKLFEVVVSSSTHQLSGLQHYPTLLVPEPGNFARACNR
ncbi:unnamed protein product [Pleuronectes platessa]|uniref:Uncharacterized protein n=1 Tax=Pleuronectes platessa TaxID=8262 RepID=A0A9N7YN66_PLEPL|nr:unnamed protein product [Pleuronectes platessa]